MSRYLEDDLITLPITGCKPGEKIDEKVVQLDLRNARDSGTPSIIEGSLAEFAGKIQQTCNGRLIDVTYELHITAVMNGCVCCDSYPFVLLPIEILAPERVMVFEAYYPVQANQPVEGKEYAGGVPATGYPQYQNAGYPQAPSPYPQNPQLQYAGAPASQLNGAVQTKEPKNHLNQKSVDETPADENRNESSGESV
jgi:hypothetical protein